MVHVILVFSWPLQTHLFRIRFPEKRFRSVEPGWGYCKFFFNVNIIGLAMYSFDRCILLSVCLLINTVLPRVVAIRRKIWVHEFFRALGQKVNISQSTRVNGSPWMTPQLNVHCLPLNFPFSPGEVGAIFDWIVKWKWAITASAAQSDGSMNH